jgi:hypothetical protein
MADSITPANVTCPQSSIDYEVKSDGEGYGGSKAAALEAARSHADAKGALQPACPRGCTDERVDKDPPYDSGRPEYTAYGRGWKCTVERTRTVTLACRTSTSSRADRPPREHTT